MATSEQIRNRIVELIKNNEFNKTELLKVISQLIHEGYYDNNDIIEMAKHLVDDILQAKTRPVFAKEINPRTKRKRSVNAYLYWHGEKFYLSETLFICDNR